MRNDANGTALALPPAPVASVPTLATPSKTKHHWRILRRALLSKTRDEASDTTASSISTEFFPQFCSQVVKESEGLGIADAAQSFEWHVYDIARDSDNPVVPNKSVTETKSVFVHEKQKRQKVSLAELFSHKLNNGVDNTGNIRTWPSEQILLAHLLRTKTCKKLSVEKGSPIYCCELGGGMAGLASLGVLAHEAQYIERMLVTDGNPQSVENLQRCVQVNTVRGVIPSQTATAELLRWDRVAQFPVSMRHQFDLVFASDCLFFEEFHEDLAYTMNELLKPQSGVCYLLQPSRNASMERFCSIARQNHNLQIEIVRDYDPEIVRKHTLYVDSRREDYIPDVHFPVLLVVKNCN